jgi:hypothetical protein
LAVTPDDRELRSRASGKAISELTPRDFDDGSALRNGLQHLNLAVLSIPAE